MLIHGLSSTASWDFQSYVWFFVTLIVLTSCFSKWPNVINTPIVISLDTIIWATCNVYVHGSSLIRILMDERPVSLSDEEESLWRYFYRRSGISRIVFKKFLAGYCQMVSFSAGDDIPHEDSEDGFYLYIIYSGKVNADAIINMKKLSLTLYSGEIFDIQHLNQFGLTSGFSKQRLDTNAHTDCSCFRFRTKDLHDIVLGNDLARSAWQAISISCLVKIAERPWSSETSNDSQTFNTFDRQHSGFLDPGFRVLEDYEYVHGSTAGSGRCWYNPCWNFGKILAGSFSPPWPFSPCVYGIRHRMISPPVAPPDGKKMPATSLDIRESEECEIELQNI